MDHITVKDWLTTSRFERPLPAASLQGRIARETERALLFESESWKGWLPKSQIVTVERSGEPEPALAPAPEVPEVVGKLTLRPYQLAGARFLLERESALLADDMGVGKTAQALAALAVDSSRRPALVVCPASVKLAWAKEAARLGLSHTVISGRKGTWPFALPDVTVINWDILSQHAPAITRAGFRTMIADEAHYAKSRTAIRTKALLSLRDAVPVRWALTGTPILNRPAEIWPILTWLRRQPAPYYGYRDFTARYANAREQWLGQRFVWVDTGASNLGELSEKLAPFTLRRLKSEILTELPPTTRTVLDWDLPASDVREYQQASRDFEAWWQATYEKPLNEDAAPMLYVTALHRLAELAKVRLAVEYLHDIVDSGKSVVVWTNFKESRRRFETAFPDALSIHGEQDAKTRQVVVEAFQAGESPLVICNLQAASEGITLTRSDTALFVGVPWSPLKLRQAEDRIHRIGQENPVTWIYPLALPFDNVMWDMLTGKASVVNQVVKGDHLDYREFARILRETT